MDLQVSKIDLRHLSFLATSPYTQLRGSRQINRNRELTKTFVHRYKSQKKKKKKKKVYELISKDTNPLPVYAVLNDV